MASTETRSGLGPYVDALYAGDRVALRRILSDADGYLQTLITTASGEAAASASNAAAAANSASAAANSAGAAASSEAQSQTLYTQISALMVSFSRVWYGTLPSDPATDPNGNPPINGAGYFNSTEEKIRIYNGSKWDDYDEEAEQLSQQAAVSAAYAAQSAAAASTSASNAAASASTANTRAGAASTSANNAASSATAAVNNATYAAQQATAAANSASSAANSVVSANSAASTASANATAAGNSASAAANSAGTAAAYANEIVPIYNTLHALFPPLVAGYFPQVNSTGTAYQMTNLGNVFVPLAGNCTIVGPVTFQSDITVRGTMYGTATSALYGDLAEHYLTRRHYRPGTLVGLKTPRSKRSRKTYEVEAAVVGAAYIGVVSTRPGVTINTQLTSGQKIGIIGRVPTRVVGVVDVGDPISLSDIPGVGIVGRHEIIGHAITASNDVGEKLIEVALFGGVR